MLRALLAVLLVAAPWAAAAQDLEARARALHRDAIVVDGHNHVPMLADYVGHVARVARVDHMGLGSDFDETAFLPDDMRTVDDFPDLTVELARCGWSDADLRKLLGENLLRVLARVQALAATPGQR